MISKYLWPHITTAKGHIARTLVTENNTSLMKTLFKISRHVSTSFTLVLVSRNFEMLKNLTFPTKKFECNLANIMEAIGVVWWWFVSVTKSFHDIFKLKGVPLKVSICSKDHQSFPPQIPSKQAVKKIYPKNLKNSDIVSS